jgi:transposase
MRDYTGRGIYLGIDVHKKTYSITAVCEKQVIKTDTIQADPEELLKYGKQFRNAKIYSAYEAGFCGFNLHRYLIKQGWKNIVVHAASIEVEANRRSKTDVRDSRKLATQLAEGRLVGINVPSEEREQYQALTRLRDKLVRDKTRTSAQLKMLIYKYGLMQLVDDKTITYKWLKKIQNLKIEGPLKYSLDEHVQLWCYLDSRIKLLNIEIKKQAVIDYEIERVYRSAPCIGPTSARILANELGDMSQFSSEGKLFSYLGLTPREHSSGEHKWLGHITRQGKPILRKILIQVSWKAIKEDESLKNTFESLARRIGKRRAIVAIAKRLIGRIRACFRNKTLYKDGKKPIL